MKLKIGQEVRLTDEFYNELSGIILEYRDYPIDNWNQFDNMFNPTQYLVGIDIENKRLGRTIFHKVWINEGDLK